MRTILNSPRGAALTATLGAALLSANVGAVNLSGDGVGEVAIAPYYTTRSGWLTLINLTNTQPVPIVVKVRIHEGQNSRDVLDFGVALSANDQWVAVIREDAATSRPVLDIRDTDTCIIGSATTVKSLNELGFSEGGNEDGGPSGVGDPDAIDRMREGYVEFVVQGHALPDDGIAGVPPLAPTDPTSVGESIEAHDCPAVAAAFNSTNIATTAQEFGEPINALKFNFRLLNPGRGMEAGGQAVTWANFFNHVEDPTAVVVAPEVILPDGGAKALGCATATSPAPLLCTAAGATGQNGTNTTCAVDRGAEKRGAIDWNPLTTATGAGSACRNLITAQVDFDFLEPSLNDVFPRYSFFLDDQSVTNYLTDDPLLQASNLNTPNRTQTLSESRGSDMFSATIQRSSAINEFAVETSLGSDTDWIITFPTKTFYVDKGNGEQFGVWVDGDRSETVYGASGVVTPLDPLVNGGTGLNPPYPPFSEAFLPFGVDPLADPTPTTADGQSCDEVSFTVFDREENSPESTGDVIDSPAPTSPTDDLCFEVNVINFSTTGSDVAGVLDSELDTFVNLVPLLAINPDAEAGWMELDLNRTTNANIGLPAVPIGPGAGRPIAAPNSVQGLPAIGFMIKQRDLNTPSTNYASTIEHAWTRVLGTYVTWNP